MQQMKLKSITPWFGGKRTLAPKIVELFGEHKQYFEPFCGSMAVLFAKEPCHNEVVNDLHGDLVNLARVLADSKMAHCLHSRLQGTLVCEDLLKQAERELDSTEPPNGFMHGIFLQLNRAYWYFLASWMARNGVDGMERTNFQMAVRWTPNEGSPVKRWESAIDSIPAWHDRLRNVTILKRDAFKILLSIPDREDTVIYCDPPYISDSRSHGKYKHDFNQLDHERLSSILGNFKETRVVVSYYDCEQVRDLYPDWNFISVARNKNLHNQNGRESKKIVAPEVLITNF